GCDVIGGGAKWRSCPFVASIGRDSSGRPQRWHWPRLATDAWSLPRSTPWWVAQSRQRDWWGLSASGRSVAGPHARSSAASLGRAMLLLVQDSVRDQSRAEVDRNRTFGAARLLPDPSPVTDQVRRIVSLAHSFLPLTASLPLLISSPTFS